MGKIILKPQPGPQEKFHLACKHVDIVIFGGAVGGGKTRALLMEAARNVNNPNYRSVIFRRQSVQIDNQGALWDESTKVYGLFPTTPRDRRTWTWPSGAVIQFAHLKDEDDKLGWQGAQVDFIAFDELTHFTESQFWYLASRNRSVSGVRPYMAGTCNPDPDSFVAKLVEWWIDQKTGYAIPERDGVVRYFVRVNDDLIWSFDKKDLADKYPEWCWTEVDGKRVKIGPKSLTFIASKLDDNAALMRVNPEYKASMLALPTVERERLLNGNWKIRDERTIIFKPSWWKRWPEGKKFPKILHTFASWDTAFTAADLRLGGQKQQDMSRIAYSACLVLGVWLDEADASEIRPDGKHKLLLLSSWWGRVEWDDLRRRVAVVTKRKLTKETDAHLIENAASGRSLIQTLRKNPTNRIIGITPTPGDGKHEAKVLRAYLSQTPLRNGSLWIPQRDWAEETVNLIGGFPGGMPPSADLADCLSMAIQYLVNGWWIHHPDDDLALQQQRQEEELEEIIEGGEIGRGGGFYG